MRDYVAKAMMVVLGAGLVFILLVVAVVPMAEAGDFKVLRHRFTNGVLTVNYRDETPRGISCVDFWCQSGTNVWGHMQLSVTNVPGPTNTIVGCQPQVWIPFGTTNSYLSLTNKTPHRAITKGGALVFAGSTNVHWTNWVVIHLQE